MSSSSVSRRRVLHLSESGRRMYTAIIGSFILAEAMFVHGVDRRIAFSALSWRFVGTSGARIGFQSALAGTSRMRIGLPASVVESPRSRLAIPGKQLVIRDLEKLG